MRTTTQLEIGFTTHGGARRGAGRKRTVRSRVEHRARAKHVERHPLHVTMRLVKGLPSLREHGAHRVLRAALHAAAERFGVRVVQYSAQTNHVHLVVEATDERALARGMKGLAVRIARGLNRAWKRGGSLFADRYHARALGTPREVRNALVYVLANARKHGVRMATVLDPFSSASSFDGWLEHAALARSRLARASTWLLGVGWRRHGAISVLSG